jgi:putative peptide zinc metalloprotease protein
MTERSFLSPNWHRVAALRPRLRAHVRFHRTMFRGQPWYVMQDRTSGRFHRFSPEAWLLVSLMDGRRSMEEVWTIAAERLADEVLTQDEALRLLGQLHAADVLHGDVPPDIAELAERGRQQRRRRLMMSLVNPLALRLPLIDPDEFLNAMRPLARLVFSGFGAAVFLGVLGYALLLAGQHWSALGADVADRVFAAESILLLLLTYPIVKAFHELGHAFALKRWGGEVHEIGVMFLVLIPVPYVDASDSMSFPSKWRRAVVGGAGIMVELFLAALAMIVWVNAEPGLVKAFAFSVMLIGGVSTLLFNGNPLLRFDGYYVLSDLIEIPNLAQRANQYIGFLVQRHAFGIEAAVSPVTARGEAPWLFGYAIAAFCYRIVITIGIALLIGTSFFMVGLLLVIWSAVLMLGVPLAKQIRFLFTSPMLRRRRGRAFAVTGGAIGALALGLLALPLPHATLAEGVVWVRGEAALHAGAEGVVVRLAAEPNAELVPGAPILELEDPALAARARMLAGRVAELEAHHAMRDLSDPVRARITLEELTLARADLDLARERLSQLTIRSRAEGRLSLHRPDDLIGRYLRKGELIGYVARFEEPVIRVVVAENDADLVLSRTRGVALRTQSERARVLPARIERVSPRLEESVPSLALATQGGGQVLLDPTQPAQSRTIGRYLQLDLVLEGAGLETARFGERVHVRFAHDEEPAASRFYRALRQVFLRHFNV